MLLIGSEVFLVSVPGSLGLSRRCPLQTARFHSSYHRTYRRLSCWRLVYLQKQQMCQTRKNASREAMKPFYKIPKFYPCAL